MDNSTSNIVAADNRPREGQQAGDGMRRPLLSIIIPVYNEEENVGTCYHDILSALQDELGRYDIEFVFTDNHSTDSTFQRLRSLAEADSRVRLFRFSKNFGFQKSILTGYSKARGDAAAQIDCDLEDPPHLISAFLRKWEEGYKVVYGIRQERQDPWRLRQYRRLFYWLVDTLSEDHLPREAGDFRLIDRVIIDELVKINDPNIYIRGRIASMGFDQVGIPFRRNKRKFGQSKSRFWTLLSMAVDAITSHSVVPLRLATLVGILATSFSVLAVVGYSTARLTFGIDWPQGWTTLAVLVLFGIGLNGMFLGIIGEYLARIYLHLKNSGGVTIETAIDPYADRYDGP